jgi:MFS family permease
MEEKEMYSGYRWLMLLATCIAVMSCYIDMIAYAPILGEIAKGMQLDMGAATNLMMGFVLATACVLIWGGTVSDKYGITFAQVLGLLCATVPATFMPWIGHSYGPVFVSRLIQGASVGFVFATIGPVMALWFPPKQQGIAGGLMIGSLAVGSAIGVVTSPAVYGATGSWQTTVAILSLLGWVAIIFSLIVTRRPPSAKVVEAVTQVMQSAAGKLTFGQALKLPVTWIGSFMMVCNAWGLYCLYNLVPPYLAAPAPMGIGMGPGKAGALSLAVTVIGIFAMILGGVFFDKVTKGKAKPAIIIGFVLTGVFTYLILSPGVYSSMGLLVICLLIAGWGVPFQNPSVSAFIAMNYPPNIVGSMVGWWFGFATFGGALGLYLGGKSIAATGSFHLAITMISLACIAGLILSFFVKPRRA